MNDAALKSATHDIVVDEVFPHAPETIWNALTTEALIGRWLMMTPTGFEAKAGARFPYQTTPAGEWDGVIHCQVLEGIPNERLAYAWTGGHEGNVGYGSRPHTPCASVRPARAATASPRAVPTPDAPSQSQDPSRHTQ